MLWIRISYDTSMMHNFRNGFGHDKRERLQEMGCKDTEGLIKGNSKEVSPWENRDASIDRVKERVAERAKLLNGKIVFGFVVSETDLYSQYSSPGMGGRHLPCGIAISQGPHQQLGH
jgi:hypothetical protein